MSASRRATWESSCARTATSFASSHSRQSAGTRIEGGRTPSVTGTETASDSARCGRASSPATREQRSSRSRARESLISSDARIRRRARTRPNANRASRHAATKRYTAIATASHEIGRGVCAGAAGDGAVNAGREIEICALVEACSVASLRGKKADAAAVCQRLATVEEVEEVFEIVAADSGREIAAAVAEVAAEADGGADAEVETEAVAGADTRALGSANGKFGRCTGTAGRSEPRIGMASAA